MDNKNKRFSFREMEFIAVEFAKSCMKGYKGSFEDYMKEMREDWRSILKQSLKAQEDTNIEGFHRDITTPYLALRDLNISHSNGGDNGCNCGQPSCSFGCA